MGFIPVLFRGHGFQSTLPMGGATPTESCTQCMRRISIHAPRGGSDLHVKTKTGVDGIFQSTLPVGGATTRRIAISACDTFQSTLPVGGATTDKVDDMTFAQFQSTLPVGGATPMCRSERHGGKLFQSTLPVGGATLKKENLSRCKMDISIHAPRGGSDKTATGKLTCSGIFQSTLPVGGATFFKFFQKNFSEHFNPRSPWGERQ